MLDYILKIYTWLYKIDYLANYNKLFTLDSETIDILKDSKNQSKYVRDAVKHYFIKDKVVKDKEPKELLNAEVEIWK